MKKGKIRKKIEKEIEKGMKEECGKSWKSCCTGCGCGSGIYGLGFIGSAVYYIQTATGFWNGVWGFIKALLWPAFLLYEALKFIGA